MHIFNLLLAHFLSSIITSHYYCHCGTFSDLNTLPKLCQPNKGKSSMQKKKSQILGFETQITIEWNEEIVGKGWSVLEVT